MAQDAKRVDRSGVSEGWRISHASIVLHGLVAKAGNPLFTSCFASLERIGLVPVVPGFESPFASRAVDVDGGLMTWMFSSLLLRDADEVQYRFEMCIRDRLRMTRVSSRLTGMSMPAGVAATLPPRPRQRASGVLLLRLGGGSFELLLEEDLLGYDKVVLAGLQHVAVLVDHRHLDDDDAALGLVVVLGDDLGRGVHGVAHGRHLQELPVLRALGRKNGVCLLYTSRCV